MRFNFDLNQQLFQADVTHEGIPIAVYFDLNAVSIVIMAKTVNMTPPNLTCIKWMEIKYQFMQTFIKEAGNYMLL